MNYREAINDMYFFIGAYDNLLETETNEYLITRYKKLKESCKLAIETMEKQIPKHPKFYRRYEYSDADGNRGIWETGFECPNCECDLNSDDLDVVCSDCFQRLEWEVQNAVDVEID